MSKIENTIRLVFLGYLLFGISSTAVDPLVPLFVENFGVGFDMIGIVLLIGAVTSVASNVFFGRVCDRIETKWTLLFGVSMLFIGFLLFGVLYSFPVFVLIVILTHLGYGSIWPSLSSYIANRYPKKRTVLFVKVDRFYYLGAALCPLLISVNLFLDLSPRYTFLLFSAIFFGLFFIYLSSFPSDKRGIFSLKKTMRAALISSQDDKKHQKISEIFNLTIILTGFVLMFYTSVLISLSVWMTTYLEYFDIPVSYGSVVVSSFWFFAIAGLFITSAMLKKASDIKVLSISCLIGTSSLTIFTFVQITFIKLLFLIIVGAFIAGTYALCLSIAIRQNPKASGTVSGFCIAMGITGSIFLQPLIGYVAEYRGRENLAFVILGVALLGLLLLFFLYLSLKRKKIFR